MDITDLLAYFRLNSDQEISFPFRIYTLLFNYKYSKRNEICTYLDNWDDGYSLL